MEIRSKLAYQLARLTTSESVVVSPSTKELQPELKMLSKQMMSSQESCWTVAGTEIFFRDDGPQLLKPIDVGMESFSHDVGMET